MQKTKIKPRINAAYYDFIPRPNAKDRRRLKESIRRNGVEIPLILNRDGFIMDGHTRYEICQELGITDIPTEIKEFSDEESERKFVIMTNLSRRHLNRFQKIELSLPLLELEEKRAKERMNWRKLHPELAKISGNGHATKMKGRIKEGGAAEIFGKKIGIGKTTVAYFNYLKKNAPTELLLKCRNGEIAIQNAYYLHVGQRLMSSGVRPEKTVDFCPKCNSKTARPKRTKCHVHKWFCCEHCKWGI